MMSKNDQNFRKNAVCEAQTEFGRPCRGWSPFQGWAPGRAAKIGFARRWRYFSGNFGHFSASWPNTSLSRDFSKTHSWTCHLHSWIALGLTLREKLVRSETNSQILRNLHFCHHFFPLGARGKPSTFVYRAGWLVEPFHLRSRMRSHGLSASTARNHAQKTFKTEVNTIVH